MLILVDTVWCTFSLCVAAQCKRSLLFMRLQVVSYTYELSAQSVESSTHKCVARNIV